MTKLYGELGAEKIAIDNEIARNIALEISKFGVNDRQRWMLIYLISLEFENNEDMQAVAGFVRDVKEDLFLSDRTNEQKTTLEG